MACYNAVQQKVSCIFEINVIQGQSEKRHGQSFRVEATDQVCPEASNHDISHAWVSEKLDGTCCYIANFKESKPWLWARLDRRPNKMGEKKMNDHKSARKKWLEEGKNGSEPVLKFSVATDFKTVPDHWIPASGVPIQNEELQPDANGHIPGWVPVDPNSRQHLWHLASVDLKDGLALVLRESSEKDGGLVVECVGLNTLLDRTAELIGTHINGNPYCLGSKKFPVHLLVIHGAISSTKAKGRPLERQAFVDFFGDVDVGQVEGLVWHCQDGDMFKLHRHHLGLPWPIPKPYLTQRAVFVDVNPVRSESGEKDWPLFRLVAQLFGQTLSSLSELHTASSGIQ